MTCSSPDDDAVVDALKAGDETVFCDVVGRWSGIILRLALLHVGRRAVAEEVVQDTWLTVLRSIDRFERRSALRTWVFGIAINVARARARTEGKMAHSIDHDGPSVDPRRFLPGDHPRWPYHWAVEPIRWPTPEDQLLAAEASRIARAAIDSLPHAQREVLVLRDLEGLSAVEVCNILSLTDTHQRVLLHRARSRVRAALDRYVNAPEAS
jgi:RNA polymerase sigma-70 factor (ECF subfamily)